MESEASASTATIPYTENKIFSELRDTLEEGPICMESLCMNCHEQGSTRLLLTSIPHFREIVLTSFECPHCGWRNNGLEFGGQYGYLGTHEVLKVVCEEDLNRQVVKADSATISIPELDFEMPAITQKGTLNTIEGFVRKSIEDLQDQQPVRRITTPEVAAQIDAFVARLEALLKVEQPWTFAIDDPAGNSNIQNSHAPKVDPNLTKTFYKRSKEQNVALGLGMTEDDVNKEALDKQNGTTTAATGAAGTGPAYTHGPSGSSILSQEQAEKLASKIAVPSEVLEFEEKCYNCERIGTLRMVMTDIPHFKEIVLMAFSCDHCGYKNTEVKSGGSISAKGKRIVFNVTNTDDMSRDLLKSDTASVTIPELDVEISEGSMGGMFTTIEGLLSALARNLAPAFQFSLGDSSASESKTLMGEFLARLDEYQSGNIPFTIIIDDPVANSYLQNLYAPDPDPELTITEYERSFEQNDRLGLNDMNTDTYQNEQHAAAAATTEGETETEATTTAKAEEATEAQATATATEAEAAAAAAATAETSG